MATDEGPASAGPFLQYAQRGWPVLAVRPGAKEPATAHGVNDATTDPDIIRDWLKRWPEMNVGVACGAPGPQVLDVDDLDRGREVLAKLADLGVPEVATARGRQLYFQGTDAATIGLEYGELRGRGSYVVAPPSVHPSGKVYTWLAEPNGALVPVPRFVAGDRKAAGAGEADPVEHVPPGAMYQHLVDRGVRLARAGITSVAAIERALKAEFETVKVPSAVYNGDETDTRRIAHWAAESRIARRENRRSATVEADTVAALDELTALLGLDEARRRVVGAQLFGRGSQARAVIRLDNDHTLLFESLAQMARPQNLLAELAAVAGVVPDLKQPACMRAIALTSRIAVNDMRIGEVDLAEDWGTEYLQAAATVDTDLRDQAQRWGAFQMLADHDPWARARENATSLARAGLVLRDWDGARLVRAGWFLGFVRATAPRVSHISLPPLMAQAGWALPKKMKATRPGMAGTQILKLYVAPAGWEDGLDAA
jgi:hypothetical protein